MRKETTHIVIDIRNKNVKKQFIIVKRIVTFVRFSKNKIKFINDSNNSCTILSNQTIVNKVKSLKNK